MKKRFLIFGFAVIFSGISVGQDRPTAQLKTVSVNAGNIENSNGAIVVNGEDEKPRDNSQKVLTTDQNSGADVESKIVGSPRGQSEYDSNVTYPKQISNVSEVSANGLNSNTVTLDEGRSCGIQTIISIDFAEGDLKHDGISVEGIPQGGNMTLSKFAYSGNNGLAASPITSISDGDHLFVVVNLNGKLGDYGNEAVYLRMTTDGADHFRTAEIAITNENIDDTYICFPIISSPQETKYPEATLDMMEGLVMMLKNPSHVITVSFLSQMQYLQFEDGAILESQVTFNAPGGTGKLVAVRDEFKAIEMENAIMPVAMVSNSILEDDIKAVGTELFMEEVTPLRATIQENWNVEYDDYGIAAYRYLHGFVAIKVTRTGKCYYRMLMVGQDHLGGGKYGETYLYNPDEYFDLIEMNCANVGK